MTERDQGERTADDLGVVPAGLIVAVPGVLPDGALSRLMGALPAVPAVAAAVLAANASQGFVPEMRGEVWSGD